MPGIRNITGDDADKCAHILSFTAYPYHISLDKIYHKEQKGSRMCISNEFVCFKCSYDKKEFVLHTVY